MKRYLTALAVSAAALGLFAASASAAVEHYTSIDTLMVPNNTGIAGDPSSITVPSGLTPVSNVTVEVKPQWNSGGTDLELRLDNPAGKEVTLMTTGCSSMDNTTDFTFDDSALVLADDTIDFCDSQRAGGRAKPNNPSGQKLSDFNGGPSSGIWTMAVRDVGLQAGGGTWHPWTLNITHAPLTLSATATTPKQKLKKSVSFNVTCNADCSIATGGSAAATTVQAKQNAPTPVTVALTKKAAKKLKKGGKKVSVIVTATDPIGQTATQTVTVKKSKKKN